LKRRRVANGFSGGHGFCRAEKNSVVLEHDPPVEAKTIANGERRVANGFSGGHGFCRAEKFSALFKSAYERGLGEIETKFNSER
jgi:hypothetical protein